MKKFEKILVKNFRWDSLDKILGEGLSRLPKDATVEFTNLEFTTNEEGDNPGSSTTFVLVYSLRA